MNEILVIYHKDCIDGFISAYIAWKEFGDKADYVGLGYDERHAFFKNTEFQGRTVYILDFSFSKVKTKYIISVAENVIWLDHHKTAFEEWLGADRDYYGSEDAHSYILLNKEKSGAMLTWEYFNGDIDIPNSVKYIDDRDRWKFKYPETKLFHLAISQIPTTFEHWNTLNVLGNTTAESLVMVGGTIQEYYDTQLKRSMEQTKENCLLKGRMGLCCNLPPMFSSDAGHILATESGTFGATWFRGSDGKCKWSLRSNGDFDVSEIAKYYGGGGHKNAAGFVVDYPKG